MRVARLPACKQNYPPPATLERQTNLAAARIRGGHPSPAAPLQTVAVGGASLKNVLRAFWERLRKNVLGQKTSAGQTVEPLSRCKLLDADAIVTTNEVTDRHGTGVLLSRIFGECPNILSIRSTSLYREHKLGRGEL